MNNNSVNINIDVLRIIAAVMVLSVHIGQCVGINLDAGAYGVKLFFIISGYLSMKSFPRYSNAKSYYISRVKRILPPYYICLSLVYITDFIMYYAMGYTLKEIISGVCGIKFFRYIFFLHMLIPSENFDLWNNRSALWTMSAFAFFYLLVPLIYRIANGFWKMEVLMCVAICMTPLMVEYIGLYYNYYPESAKIYSFAEKTPMAVLYCFLIGATVYFAKEEKKEIAFFISIALMSIFTIFVYEGLFAIILMVAISIQRDVKCKKIYKLIRFASGGSFYLYLIHPIVISIVRMLFLKMEWSVNKYIYGTVLFILAVLCSYVLYIVEKSVCKGLSTSKLNHKI